MTESQLIPSQTVTVRIVVEQAPVVGRCESVCDMSFDGSDPHFCAFMEHVTGRHQCDRCRNRHTWGPMHPVFPPSVHAEPAPVGDLFDRIEKAAVDYRYQHRMPNDEILTAVVKGGMDALGHAAMLRGMPVVSHDQIVSWFLARKLVFVVWPDDSFIGDQPDVLVYKPGAFLSGPVDTADERPHSRACGIRIHNHGPACAPDCPTCVEAAQL
jgi:hypothetical protein